MPVPILITRPQPSADMFADILRAELQDVSVLVAPMMQITPGDEDLPDMGEYQSFVITSGHAINALAQNPAAWGKPCYCVGAATTQAARNAGLEAVEGGSTAKMLLQGLIKTPPPQPILYLRGDHAALDLITALRQVGFQAEQVIVYRQTPKPLSPSVLDLLQGGAPVLVPLFSARSARLFLESCPATAQIHAVAISKAVAEMIPHGDVKGLSVALHPTADHMVKALRDAAAGVNRVEQGY